MLFFKGLEFRNVKQAQPEICLLMHVLWSNVWKFTLKLMEFNENRPINFSSVTHMQKYVAFGLYIVYSSLGFNVAQ